MTTAGNENVTPVPSIHNVPAQDSGKPTPPDAQQLRVWGQQLLTGTARAVVEALLNVHVLGVDPFTALQEFGQDPASIISTIVSALGGSGTGTAGLLSALGNIPLIGPIIEALDGTGTDMTALANALRNFPGANIVGDIKNAAVDATNLYNQINSGLLGLLPSSHIGNVNPNLLTNPGFDSAASLANHPDFVWDGTVGHTTNGSAKATADGTAKTLVSNTVAVTQNQTLAASVWTKFSGITSSGTPISLAISAYDANNNFVATTVLQSIAASGSSSGWTQLSGNYTVPATVAYIVVQLQVSADATAGNVWFDDASLTKTGSIPASALPIITATMTSGLATIDSIVNALGISGSGFSLTDLANALLAIPSGNISGFGTVAAQAAAAAADVQSVIDNMVNVVTGGSSTGNPVTAVETTIGGILGGIVSQLTGKPAATATQTQANAALAAQAAALAATTASLQALQNQNTQAANGGVNVNLNFSTFANASSIAGLDQSYSPTGDGTLGIAGGAATMQPNGSGSYLAVAMHPTATMTDFQQVSCVFASAPAQSYGFYVEHAYNTLITRANSPTNPTTYVYALLQPNSVELHFVNAGSDVTVASQSITGFVAGSGFQLIAGFSGTTPIYEIYSGNNLLLNYTDSAGASHYGSGYRYCGFGMYYNDDHSLNLSPGALASFSFVDNGPVAVIGSNFRQYRASATTATLTDNAVSLFPASFFDTNSYQTADYTYAPSTNKLTVSTTGLYMVKLNVLISPLSTAAQWAGPTPVIYKNGAVNKYGRSTYFYAASSGVTLPTTQPFWFGDTFLMYLNAGDYIQPGYFNGTSSTSVASSIAGEGTGTQTYFECNFVGPQAVAA